MNPAVGIRPATAGDLDAVECVERRSFALRLYSA